MPVDPHVAVPTLLAAAGLSPSDAEVAVLVAEYPARAQALAELYALDDARYEEPGLVLHAAAFTPPLA